MNDSELGQAVDYFDLTVWGKKAEEDAKQSQERLRARIFALKSGVNKIGTADLAQPLNRYNAWGNDPQTSADAGFLRSISAPSGKIGQY